MTQGKIDPAEKVKKDADDKHLMDDMKKFDIANLKASDFKMIPKRKARVSHPFDGYPLKPKVMIGKTGMSATFIVAIKPTEEPDQDPSGQRMSITDQETKKEKIVNLKTYHSRVITVGPGQNEDVVFDRVMEWEGGEKIHYAVVPNHTTRAQIFFSYDSKSERIVVDPRYLLLDLDQSGPLNRLFQQIINPKLRRDRMAAQVAGEVESTDASLKQLPTE